MKLYRYLPSLESKSYRWLLLFSLANSAGGTIWFLSQGWLILEVTDSPLWLGVAIGIDGTVHLLLGIPAGALVDKVSRQALLFVTAAITSLAAVALALLAVTGTVTLWHILTIVLATSIVDVVRNPARQALTSEVVGAQWLLNANGLESAGRGVLGMLGSVAAGLTIDRFGTGHAYFLASACLLLSALVVLGVRAMPLPKQSGRASVQDISSGLRYAYRTREVRELLLLSVVLEGFATPAIFLLPVIVRDVLGAGGAELGYLSAAGNLGTITAGLLVIALGDFRRKEWLLLGMALAFSLFIVLFGLSHWFFASLVLMALILIAGNVYDATILTMLQSIVPREMQGRVLGLFSATVGANRVGGFGAGAVAAAFGAPVAAVAGGLVAALNVLRLVPSAKLFSAR